MDSPSLLLAFAAGFVSFVSPCCLPLVPGYLAAVSGGEPLDRTRRLDPRVMTRSFAFVLSFGSIFVLLGLGATLIGSLLFDNRQTLNTVAGGVVIGMGAFFILSVFVTRLNRDWHPQWLAGRAGRGGPAVAGAAFAVAWTPCIGPTLGAILGLAATQQGTGRGALLLGVYSAGLAVPFLLSAAAFSLATRSFAWYRRHHKGLQVASGLVLVAMGVLVASGELFRLNIEMRKALSGTGLDFLWQI